MVLLCWATLQCLNSIVEFVKFQLKSSRIMYFGVSKYLRPSPAVELSVEPHFALILMLNYGDCVLWVQCLSLPSSNVTIILKTKGFYFGLI